MFVNNSIPAQVSGLNSYLVAALARLHLYGRINGKLLEILLTEGAIFDFNGTMSLIRVNSGLFLAVTRASHKCFNP